MKNDTSAVVAGLGLGLGSPAGKPKFMAVLRSVAMGWYVAVVCWYVGMGWYMAVVWLRRTIVGGVVVRLWFSVRLGFGLGVNISTTVGSLVRVGLAIGPIQKGG